MEERGRQRKIIHCDCDSFYASVEERDDPSLVGQPLAVGGSPDARGVVATCNYAKLKDAVEALCVSESENAHG